MDNELQLFSREMSELLVELLRGVTRRETHALARGQLSVPQFLLLEALVRQSELTMQELARQAHVTKGAMTACVSRMVRAGWVRRRRDARDRRVVWVHPTPTALAMVNDVRRQKRETIQQLFAGITPQDRITYLHIFRQVCGTLGRS